MMKELLSYQDAISIIQKINTVIEQYDQKIILLQQTYQTKKKEMENSHIRNLDNLEKEITERKNNIRKNEAYLIGTAEHIKNEIEKIDNKLSSVDKYYVKAKNKKNEELSGIRTEQYDASSDYFSALEDIKNEYSKISKKYSEDILPAIINGLNYIFSNQRKRDYEQLIILYNTVCAYIVEVKGTVPEISENELQAIDVQYKERYNSIVDINAKENKLFDNEYRMAIDKMAQMIDDGLNNVMTSAEIDNMCKNIDDYLNVFNHINSSEELNNVPIWMILLEYPLDEFVQSVTLKSYVKSKYDKLIFEGKIQIPAIWSVKNVSPVFICQNNNSSLQRGIANSVIFSALSCVPVTRIKLSVIDCDGHGNNVEAFFEAKRKLPLLFGKKIYTDQDEAIEYIRELNYKIENTMQTILGGQYSSTFDYYKKNAGDYQFEVLVIYNLVSIMDEVSLSQINNIVTNSSKCGLLPIFVEGNIDNDSNNTRERGTQYEEIKRKCTQIYFAGNNVLSSGLNVAFFPMIDKSKFTQFMSKYLLAYEGIKNKGIAFSLEVKELIDCKNENEFVSKEKEINDYSTSYKNNYGYVNVTGKFRSKMVIGMVDYPDDIVANSLVKNQIKSKYSHDNFIKLPMIMDLTQRNSFYMEYQDEIAEKIELFSHHIMWNFISNAPVNGLVLDVLDCERKGGRITPFLDFRKKCPDLFDGQIYTTADSINDRLIKLNDRIDELVQNKLGNRFGNIINYNFKNPKRIEQIHLLVIYDFPSGFDSRAIDLLVNIMKNGGVCGVFTLLMNNKDISYTSYDDIEAKIERIKEICTLIDIRGGQFYLQPFNLQSYILPGLSSVQIESFISKYSDESEKAKKKGLGFEDVLDEKLFDRDCSTELVIPIGIGDGEVRTSISFGKGSSHHALVAGATGSGKSTLLHTLIMSAMVHYSPQLLNLYLMDFKSGTEFKIYDTHRLPHIKLLALDAMQEFGESILENLVDEITERSNKFKRRNVSKLSEYNSLGDDIIPRILVVMDEFQVLFNDSTNRKVANHCAELTKRIVTEGRSYGIHLLMATQSTKIISDLTLASGTVEQMRIRVGLKCGEDDARYLFTDTNDLKALELMKGPLGTAVINEEFTEQDCVGFRVAYCGSQKQEEYLKLVEDRFNNSICNTQVFEGRREIAFLDKFKSMNLSSDSNIPEAEIGALIKVADPLRIKFDRRRKHNTIICGANDNMIENIFNIYTYSLVFNQNTDVYCIDGEALLGEGINEYCNQFDVNFNNYHFIDNRGDIIQCINRLYDEYQERRKNTSSKTIIVTIKNLQFNDLLKNMLKGDLIDEDEYTDNSNDIDNTEVDPFDFGIGNSGKNVTEKLLKLIDDGGAYGIHFIVTSSEYQTIKECMFYGENSISKFPERLIFSLNDMDADSLIENVSVTSLQDNIIVYSDSVKNTFQVKPYVFPKCLMFEEYIKGVNVG